MPGFFHSSFTVYCWKDRVCAYCGCQYGYRLVSSRTGKGDTPADAERNAVARAVNYFREKIDTSPCPHCGNKQAEMVGAARFGWHIVASLSTPILLFPFLLLNEVPAWVGLIFLALFAVGIYAVQLWLITRYPQYQAAANKAQAARKMLDGEIRICLTSLKDAGERHAPASIRPGAGFWLLSTALFAGLALLASADLIRLSQDWPDNPRWRPVVAGPGETAWVYLPWEVGSLNGDWTGVSEALIERVDAPGVFIPVESSTRVGNWGDRIEVKAGEGERSSKLWIRIRLPDDPNLVGKTVRVHARLKIAYPRLEWNRAAFRVDEDAVEHLDTFQIAGHHAGVTYTTILYVTMVLPIVVIAMLHLYCIVRAHRLQVPDENATVTPCDSADKQIAEANAPASDNTAFKITRPDR